MVAQPDDRERYTQRSMQSMAGIWQQGGGKLSETCSISNEITVDDKGRALWL